MSKILSKTKVINQPIQLKLNSCEQKQQLINVLSEKNKKLDKQIRIIESILEKKRQQQTQKTNIRAPILQSPTNPQSLSKQLQNCYKKIKLYQYQVQKLQSKSNSLTILDRIAQVQIQIKQKRVIQLKLKDQLLRITKDVQNNGKKLVGKGDQQDRDVKAKTDQLRFLKQMIKDYQQREAIKQKNLKNVFNYIKKIQKQYTQSGGSIYDLQSIKQKTTKSFIQGRLISHQSISQSHINPSIQSSIINSTKLLPSQSNQIQDRTKDHYDSMCNQLRVLEKLNIKYQKQFGESQKVVSQIEERNLFHLRRIRKIQKEIEQVTQLIKEKKACILTENLKPTKIKSNSLYEIHNKSTIQDLRHIKR